MHGGSFTGDSEEGETLSGDLVYWGHREIYRRRLWKGASLSIGAPLGNLGEGGVIYRGICETDEGRLWKRSIYLYGSSARGTWRESSFSRDVEGHVKEGF
jgi:hypothetical protein